jgi:hypothetical protein
LLPQHPRMLRPAVLNETTVCASPAGVAEVRAAGVPLLYAPRALLACAALQLQSGAV